MRAVREKIYSILLEKLVFQVVKQNLFMQDSEFVRNFIQSMYDAGITFKTRIELVDPLAATILEDNRTAYTTAFRSILPEKRCRTDNQQGFSHRILTYMGVAKTIEFNKGLM